MRGTERVADLIDATGSRAGDIAERVNALITERPWRVIAAFVVVTLIFTGGFLVSGGEQQAGADQFGDETEEADALEAMNEEFDRATRDSGGTSAQLFIETERNVLAEPNLLRMLEFQETVEETDGLRVTSTTSPASLVAEQLNPEATTAEEQYRVVDRSAQRDLTAAIAEAEDTAGLPVSDDFTEESASADVAQIAVTYDVPPNADTGNTAPLQFETMESAYAVDGFSEDNVVVFGDAVIEEETIQLLGDTAIVVFPAAILLIVFFLLVAYRDPVDLGLGMASLLMTLVWTFGFMGYARIPFSDALITVFPLLLAVGIDFGIHIINRYREERAAGKEIPDAMGVTADQLATAFLIVTITTVFSFAANLTSSMDSMQDFGVVAAFGMVFTFAIFGVLLPAGKVASDRLREGTRFPEFGTTPLGSEGSVMGRVLSVGTGAARVAPVVVLVVVLVVGAGAGAYGTGVDTEFNEEAFFPDEDRVEQYESLPAPFQPGEYTFMEVLDYLEEDFGQGLEGSVTVFVDDRDLRDDDALSAIERAHESPPDAFESSDRRAEADSVLDEIDAFAASNPSFEETITRHDTTGNGVPDRNVDQVYEELLDDGENEAALNYLTTDRSSTRIDFQVSVDADETEAANAAEEVASDMPLDATATGQLVVFQSVIEDTTESSVTSLVVAFLLTAVFLMLSYRWLEGRAVYGLINLVPVLLTVTLLAGSMRYFDVALTPINAPILAVSIGLGVDYTVHFMHRFVDELKERADVHEALAVTVRGTGGALTGSMLTTVCGLGVLYVALIPLIMEFGLLLALGVFYAYVCSIVVLPSAIVVWARLADRFGEGAVPASAERS